MNKGTALLVVPLFHRIGTRKHETRADGTQTTSISYEDSKDGTIEKRTICYTCPSCKAFVFYGDNYQMGKTEIREAV
jgi:hypothetical protein